MVSHIYSCGFVYIVDVSVSPIYFCGGFAFVLFYLKRPRIENGQNSSSKSDTT